MQIGSKNRPVTMTMRLILENITKLECEFNWLHNNSYYVRINYTIKILYSIIPISALKYVYKNRIHEIKMKYIYIIKTLIIKLEPNI